MNKIVEDRLQRSITELNFKQRKSVEKIDRQIDVVKRELKDIRINIDFSSDLGINGVKHWTKSPIYKSPQTFSKDLEPPRFAFFCLYLYLVCMILPYICRYENLMV